MFGGRLQIRIKKLTFLLSGKQHTHTHRVMKLPGNSKEMLNLIDSDKNGMVFMVV